jgi:GT2 family glycosyltransferase
LLLYTWLFGLPYSLQERVEKTSEILSAKGASMMIRKDLFEKLGGFDEKFFATFEDLDLG